MIGEKPIESIYPYLNKLGYSLMKLNED